MAAAGCSQLVPSATTILFLLLASTPALAHTNSKASWPRHVRRLLDQRFAVSSSLTRLTESGQVTQVSVRDSSSSSSSKERFGHLLALYSSGSDASKVLPYTFVNISSASPSYLSTGAASLPIKLLNLRSPGFVLRLVSNSTFHPAVLAESAVITNTIPNAPGQVHLAQHADGRSIVVQWVSGSSSPQQLEYSTAPFPNQASTSSSSSKAAASSGGSSGAGGDRLVHTVTSSSLSYTADMMCAGPANSFGFLHPGYLHAAVIPGDKPNQQLYYRLGSYSVGWTPAHSFTTAPSSADVAAGRASFTFLVFNDVGQENAVLFDNVCPPYCPAGWQFELYTANSTKLMRHLRDEPEARLGLLVGDVAYANGFLVDWDYFGFQFEPAFSKWPLMVAKGNHEQCLSDSGGECGIPYTYRYYTPAWAAPAPSQHRSAITTETAAKSAPSRTVPAPPPIQPHEKQRPPPVAASLWSGRSGAGPSTETSYYSFEMGGVHFVMLDSEAPSDSASPQGTFVAADLAKVDRQRTPWLVVGLHRQMVGPTTDPVNVANLARLQHDLEDAFLQYRVDLVLQGHDHAYARTCPFAKGSCSSNAPGSGAQHTSGSRSPSHANGGTGSRPAAPGSSKGRPAPVETVHDPKAPIYILAGHAGAGFTHAFPKPLPEWVAYGVQDMNGYLRVTATANTLTAVSVSTDDGHVMDGVQIVRGRAYS